MTDTTPSIHRFHTRIHQGLRVIGPTLLAGGITGAATYALSGFVDFNRTYTTASALFNDARDARKQTLENVHLSYDRYEAAWQKEREAEKDIIAAKDRLLHTLSTSAIVLSLGALAFGLCYVGKDLNSEWRIHRVNKIRENNLY